MTSRPVSVLLSNFADVRELLALAQRCEHAGLGRVWLAETAGVEAASMGALLAHATGLEVGTAIVPVYSRSAAVLAMMAATWSGLGNGRTVHLGIGAGGKGIIENWHGIEYDRPLATTRDTLRILRQLLAGERSDYSGSNRRSSGMTLATGAADVRLYIGGVGPKMVELAAAEADGLIVTWLSPGMLRNFRTDLNAATRTFERDPAAVRLVARVYVGVGDDVGAIREGVRKELVEYIVSPGYARFFTDAGFGESVAAVTEAFRARDRQRAVAAVSDELLDQLLVTGRGATEIDEALTAYAAGGADEIMVQPVPAARGGDPRRTIDAIAEVAASW